MSYLARRLVGRTQKRILVVDDNEMLLKFWDRLLGKKHLNYDNYRTTKNPLEALHWMENTRFDLAIIDIVMPRMDGFDFVREAWKQNPDMQLVFTTAYACDFRNVSLSAQNENRRDVHVLLKPYQDISKIEEFISRLNDNEPSLNETTPVLNESRLRFHLWKL